MHIFYLIFTDKLVLSHAKRASNRLVLLNNVRLILQEQQPFDGKKACWVPDEHDGFVRAEIVSSKGDDITVKVLKSNEVSYCSPV